VIKSNNLNTEGMLHIYDGLINLAKIQNFKLKIYSNNINSKGAKSIAKFLSNLKNLSKLHVFIGNNNKIEQEGLKAISSSIKN